ncbi:hypothetical protein [Mesorhizobium captivum]|uniref:hypothetical protein n=1 Tax=Mesorhizobium captivum TaxID=3072319 RepID=UPI002A2485DD|nr:hypothetical protein [Mesorhizobium sp. VK23E]MDX8514831.1 hypothetical protein [Mesorhizobium sp. VK23E]
MKTVWRKERGADDCWGIRLLLSLAVAASLPAFAGKNGFDSDTTTTSGQGNGEKTNDSANPDNNGQTTTTTTTSGPHGQIKSGDTSCNNCSTTTTTDEPGKNR